MKKQLLLIVLSAFMGASTISTQTRIIFAAGFFISHLFISQLILNILKKPGYCVIEN